MGDKRVERTRAALKEALIALASEKPFADITIAEITERAGIGYATFFRHYREKEALLADLAEALIDQLLARMMPALEGDDTLTASIALCRFVDERRHICSALLAGGAAGNIRDLSLARARSISGFDMATSTSAGPVSLILDHAVGSTLGLLAGWLEASDAVDPEEMGRIIDQLAIRPVGQTLSSLKRP